MAKEWAKKFYNSKAWKVCRDSYIQERVMLNGGLCEECQENVGYIVHHKITLTQDNINVPDISLNHKHLMYVCKECHDSYEGHGIGKAGQEALFAFDADGQPISLREIDINNTSR